MSQPSVEQINAVLPQTQCRDCGFQGCKPYAEAMANGAAEINLCPPGGQRVLQKLANLFNKNPADYSVLPKPLTVAVIDEPLCIGCTKCIQACPVDAISGAAKLMHTVITDECTGCGLCVEPCPMDCIDMQAVTTNFSETELQQRANHARQRYETRNARLARDAQDKEKQHQRAKLSKADILATIARAKAKKSQRDNL